MMYVILLSLVATEVLFLRLMFRKDDAGPLSTFSIINLILIALFGGKLVQFGGFVTNVANIFYAAVAFNQAYLFVNYSKATVVRTIVSGLKILTFINIVTFIMTKLPVVEGNELFSECLAVIGTRSFVITAASFIAFIIGQFSFIWMFEFLIQRKSVIVSYLISIVYLQAVDSAVFFPLAFGYNRLAVEEMVVGFIFKVIVGFMFTPLFCLLKSDKKLC